MRILIAVLAAGLASTPVLAQSSTKSTTSKQSAANTKANSKDAFVKNTAIGNMFEIQSSQVALQKAQRSDVKELAQMLIDDHTKAGNDMKQALGANGPQLPTALDSKHQQTMQKLQQASANQFDTQFLQAQATAHKEAIALFQGYARSGDDQNLKQFAQATLPALQQHPQHVSELQKGAAATASGSSKSDSMGGGNARATTKSK